MEKIKVSVIIPTYDRPKFLVNTIKSLKEQDFSVYEIIVVDNACIKNTKMLIQKEMKDINPVKYFIKYIQEPNLGLHNARHAGAKTAQGDILVYIDDDVICERNFLTEILKPYKDPEVGCVGGKILPKWEVEPLEWIKMFPKWYLSILDDDGEKREVKWIYGCNFSIRKDLLFKVGGFNPDAFDDKKMWWYRGDGENGLLRKVHSIGKKVIYNPKAIVWHILPKQRLTLGYFRERAFKSGIEVSFKKYRYDNFGRFNSLKLIIRSMAFGVHYTIHNIVANVFIFLKNKSYYKSGVLSSYYKARFLYELRLAIDKNLRKFVKKEKWLE